MRRPGLFQILRNALGANESAVTIMRLTLPGGVGNSSIPFEFAYLRRVLSVRCSLGKFLSTILLNLVLDLICWTVTEVNDYNY